MRLAIFLTFVRGYAVKIITVIIVLFIGTASFSQMVLQVDTVKAKKGIVINGNLIIGVSSDTTLSPSSDNILATQRAIKKSLSTAQPKLNGTGFVKVDGSVITYDNNTYLTANAASGAYQPVENQRLSNFNTPKFNAVTVDDGTNGILFFGNSGKLLYTSTSNGASNLTYRYDGVNDAAVLTAQNYNSFAPSLTGNGATGTWGVNITGTASAAENSVQWNNVQGSLSVNASGADLNGLIGIHTNGIAYRFDAANVRSWLGLGSNAYTSTSYLPLTGGTITGNLSGTSANFSGDITNTNGNLNIGTSGFVSQIISNNTNSAILTNAFSDGSKWAIGSDVGFNTPESNRALNFNYSDGNSWIKLLSIANDGNATFYNNVDASSFISSANGSELALGSSVSKPIVFYINGSDVIRISDGGDLLSSFSNWIIGASGNAQFNGNVSAENFYSSSDSILKQSVQYDFTNAPTIQTKTFAWKNNKNDAKKHIGYYAQEVESVLPQAVKTDNKGMKSVNYIEVHTAKIAILENEMKTLKQANERLEKDLNILKQQLSKLLSEQK